MSLYPQYPIEERHQICTLSDPTDQYYGDSGSPLMVEIGKDSDGEERRWMAVGITSWTERERQEDTHLPSESVPPYHRQCWLQKRITMC